MPNVVKVLDMRSLSFYSAVKQNTLPCMCRMLSSLLSLRKQLYVFILILKLAVSFLKLAQWYSRVQVSESFRSVVRSSV